MFLRKQKNTETIKNKYPISFIGYFFYICTFTYIVSVYFALNHYYI